MFAWCFGFVMRERESGGSGGRLGEVDAGNLDERNS